MLSLTFDRRSHCLVKFPNLTTFHPLNRRLLAIWSNYRFLKEVKRGLNSTWPTLTVNWGRKRRSLRRWQRYWPKISFRWKFMTENSDVGYQILSKNEAGEEEELLAYQRVDSHLTMEEGALFCLNPSLCNSHLIYFLKLDEITNIWLLVICRHFRIRQ